MLTKNYRGLPKTALFFALTFPYKSTTNTQNV